VRGLNKDLKSEGVREVYLRSRLLKRTVLVAREMMPPLRGLKGFTACTILTV